MNSGHSFVGANRRLKPIGTEPSSNTNPDSRFKMMSFSSVIVLIGIVSQILALPTPHYGSAGVEYEGKIYLIGGRITDPLCFNCPEDYQTTFSDVTVFEETTSDFDTREFAEMEAARVHHTAVLYEDEIYVFGGAGVNQEIEKYNIADDEWSIVEPEDDGYPWTPLGNKPCGRHSHGAVVADGMMYIFGGIDAVTGAALNDLWVFHFETAIWAEVELTGWVPQPRAGFSFIYYENEVTSEESIVLFGGYDTSLPNKYYNDVWILDITLSKWKHISPTVAPPARAYHGSTVVGGRLIIQGGLRINDVVYSGKENFLRDLWSFDVETRHWTRIRYDTATGFPSIRAQHTLVSWSHDTAFTVFSGVNAGRETLGDTWTYTFDDAVSCEGDWKQTACWPNYHFPYCILDCSHNNWCNGHGTCLHDGSCCCDAGWFGDECDANTCQDYRGFDYTQLNEILAPKSLQSTYEKLEQIAAKLEHLRELTPSLQNYHSRASGLQQFASDAYNFYQICLVEDLCEVTECFEGLLGCEEACGEETFCLVGDYCEDNKCIGGEWRDCAEDYANNSCVHTWCDEEEKRCKHSTVSCEDDDPCTKDYCDTEKGCVHEEFNCNDDDCCTLDSCVDGQCLHEDKCEDFNPCTDNKCNNECDWGTCEYAIEDCCYMSLGQYEYVQSPDDGPRPMGSPLVLTGDEIVPKQEHSNHADALFWLKACDCELLYKIDTFCAPGSSESGAHIHGTAAAGENAGVVFNLPLGDHKQGSWNFCDSGVHVDDLLNGEFYVAIYTTSGDMRTQIVFNKDLPLDEHEFGKKKRSVGDSFRG